MLQNLPDLCTVCRVGAAATAVRVFDPMAADVVLADWAFVCSGCAVAVDRVASVMMAENPRLRVHVDTLWLPFARRAA
jgi:hypothetical protein